MLCPYCRYEGSRVVDKRDNNETNVTRRRRECESCKKRFTTYERLESVDLNVIKRSERIERFDREKLKNGILRAVKKRPISINQIDELIDDVEMKLLTRKDTFIKTVDIGMMVLKRLEKIDKLGALLFASVYKEFESLEDVQTELTRLENFD